METKAPGNVKMSDSAVILNEANSMGIIGKKQKLLNDPNLWHKIIVENIGKGMRRNLLLKTIMNTVRPLDLIPVHYQREGESASFFARNCKMAIEKLCKQNLAIANPRNKNKPLKLIIILAYANTSELVINVQENISTVLTKRYNASMKTLNLHNFCKDPGLTQYCTLSQPKILYFALDLCKNFRMQSLRLTGNGIYNLSPLESIWKVTSLTTLDLQHNKISKMTELNVLKTMQITDLALNGNPLCKDYDEFTYIEAVREVCPKIEKLDGVLLGQKGFPLFKDNYVCDRKGHELVDQFIEHYFTLYDGMSRSDLNGIYHKNALFTITCDYLPGKLSASSANMYPYKAISHNINLLSDFAKCDEYVFYGGSNIINTLCHLPPTEHDPHTFTVDLVSYTDQSATVVVAGVFREVAQSLSNSEGILRFSRTFVLCSGPNGEYTIGNEQLYVTNATTIQQNNAFKIVRVAKHNYLTLEPAGTDEEKEQMAQALKIITQLNLEWSKKYLQACKYNLKKTLTLFVSLYKKDKIPEEAFLPDKPKELQEPKAGKEPNSLPSSKKNLPLSRKRKGRPNRTIQVVLQSGEKVRIKKRDAISMGLLAQ